MIGVYEIRNTATDECYIGFSTAIAGRWSQHLNALARGSHENPKLQQAWEEHGGTMFAFRVLALAETEAEARAIEDGLIHRLQPTYNQHLVDPPIPPKNPHRSSGVNWVRVGIRHRDEVTNDQLYVFRCPCCNEPHMVMFDKPEPYAIPATPARIEKRFLDWWEQNVFDALELPESVGAETP